MALSSLSPLSSSPTSLFAWAQFLEEKCGFDPAAALLYAHRLHSNKWSFKGLSTLKDVADKNIGEYGMLLSLGEASGGLGMESMSHQFGLLRGIKECESQPKRSGEQQTYDQNSAIHDRYKLLAQIVRRKQSLPRADAHLLA